MAAATPVAAGLAGGPACTPPGGNTHEAPKPPPNENRDNNYCASTDDAKAKAPDRTGSPPEQHDHAEPHVRCPATSTGALHPEAGTATPCGAGAGVPASVPTLPPQKAFVRCPATSMGALHPEAGRATEPASSAAARGLGLDGAHYAPQQPLSVPRCLCLLPSWRPRRCVCVCAACSMALVYMHACSRVPGACAQLPGAACAACAGAPLHERRGDSKLSTRISVATPLPTVQGCGADRLLQHSRGADASHAHEWQWPPRRDVLPTATVHALPVHAVSSASAGDCTIGARNVIITMLRRYQIGWRALFTHGTGSRRFFFGRCAPGSWSACTSEGKHQRFVH